MKYYEVGSTILMEHYCNVFFKNPERFCGRNLTSNKFFFSICATISMWSRARCRIETADLEKD